MSKHTRYSKYWILREVVPYLLKYHFDNKPTLRKIVYEAFYNLMGKNIEFGGRKRWTDGKTGVPHHIDRLVKEHILAEITTKEPFGDSDYPEYQNSYALGLEGEQFIRSFEKKYSRELIDREIEKYLNIDTWYNKSDLENEDAKKHS